MATTKYNIGDIVLIPATVQNITIDRNGTIKYECKLDESCVMYHDTLRCPETGITDNIYDFSQN